ncbi:MAG: hypothetical protein U0133_19560 [Gemmatimonadales bacterium]
MTRGRPLLLLGLALAGGCRGTLSPLSNKLKVGEESYVVLAADGEGGKGDLFAAAPASGTPFQVTFTRVDERAPALSHDGALLAFLRSATPTDTAGASIVILNLINGAERRVPAPAGVEALRWTPDGAALLARTPAGMLRTPAPPAALAFAPVPEAERAAADSLFRVLLGDPPAGEAKPCADGTGVCAWLASGDTVRLSATGSDPLGWSGDSVGYFEDGTLTIRPLVGGKTRVIRWDRLSHPRQPTWFAGTRIARDSALH